MRVFSYSCSVNFSLQNLLLASCASLVSCAMLPPARHKDTSGSLALAAFCSIFQVKFDTGRSQEQILYHPG